MNQAKSESENWLSWCRLCAKAENSNVVPVIQKEGQPTDPMLLAAIGKHFWVNISADDLLPQHLCIDCHELIYELQTFSQHVNKVQTMFYTLKTVDLNDLEEQQKIRKNHGVPTDACHFLHRKCADKLRQAANLETTKTADRENFVKENIVYEIIQVEEQPNNAKQLDNVEIAQENTYRLRRKRKTVTEPVVETKSTKNDKIIEATELNTNNSFDETEFCANSEIDEEKKANNNEAMQYDCEICAKKYKMFMCYKKHMLDTHNKEAGMQDFKCDCGKKFSTKKQLQLHERSHLPLEQKLLYECPYCSKKFSKATILRQHINGQHLNVKPYICDECGKALKTMAALNEHKLVHTNDCPFECEVCKKRFKNKARLKIHSDVHAESYNCTVCGLLLNTRRTLRMHMLVHSEEKQFKCDFCSQAFKRGKALKNHLILHIGLRPYKCNFCGRAFANNSNCRAHKKKIHPHELAKEEAQGVKSKAVVPGLHELRNSCLNSSAIAQKEAENTSKNLENFLVHMDDFPNDDLEVKNKTSIISIEQANEYDEEAPQYSYSDEEFALAKAEDEEDGTETIVYEVLNELP